MVCFVWLGDRWAEAWHNQLKACFICEQLLNKFNSKCYVFFPALENQLVFGGKRRAEVCRWKALFKKTKLNLHVGVSLRKMYKVKARKCGKVLKFSQLLETLFPPEENAVGLLKWAFSHDHIKLKTLMYKAGAAEIWLFLCGCIIVLKHLAPLAILAKAGESCSLAIFRASNPLGSFCKSIKTKIKCRIRVKQSPLVNSFSSLNRPACNLIFNNRKHLVQLFLKKGR